MSCDGQIHGPRRQIKYLQHSFFNKLFLNWNRPQVLMRRSKEEKYKKRWGKVIIRKRQMVKVMAKDLMGELDTGDRIILKWMLGKENK
jgi:hypothetical protein